MNEEDEKKDQAQQRSEAEWEDEKLKIEPRTNSIKKKMLSKSVVMSKSSLKKITDSTLSTVSETSSSSLTTKRQSEYDRLVKGPRYQNTYRLDPKKPFKSHEVYLILKSIVEKAVVEFPQYDVFLAPKLAQTIAAEARTSVRYLNYDRYKICVLVYLGEKKQQGFQAAFRALWDHDRDAWTTYYFEKRTYFISCTCYGLYHD